MSSHAEDIAKQAAEAVVTATYDEMKVEFGILLRREQAADEKDRVLDAREESLNAKENKLKERESKVVDYQKEGRGLAVDIIRREKKMRDLEGAIEERETEIGQREWAVMRRDREYEELEDELQEAKKRAERFRNSANRAADELGAAMRKTERLEKRVASMDSDKRRYQAAFAEQAKRADEVLNCEIVQCKKWKQNAEDLQENILDLMGTNAELKERVAFLTKENDRLRRMADMQDRRGTKPIPLQLPPKQTLVKRISAGSVSGPSYAQPTLSSRSKTVSPSPVEDHIAAKKTPLPGLAFYADSSPTMTEAAFAQTEGAQVSPSRFLTLQLPSTVMAEHESNMRDPEMEGLQDTTTNQERPSIQAAGAEGSSTESTASLTQITEGPPKRTLTPALRKAIDRATSQALDLSSVSIAGPSTALDGLRTPAAAEVYTFQDAVRRSSRWISESGSATSLGIGEFRRMVSTSHHSTPGGVSLRKKSGSANLHYDLLVSTTEKDQRSNVERSSSAGRAGYAAPFAVDEDEEQDRHRGSSSNDHARTSSRMTDERYERIKEKCRQTKAEREKRQLLGSGILSKSFL